MSVAAAPTRAALARGGSLSLVGAVVSAAMGLVLVVVLGRLLGDAGTGIVLQAVAVFTIALAVARLGTDSAALWLLPRLADERPEALRRAAAMLIGAAGAGGAICALALSITAWAAAGGSNATAALPEGVLATAWALPTAAMLATSLAATRALGGVAPHALVGGVAVPTLRPAAVAAAVVLGAGATVAAFAWTLPTLVGLAAAAVLLLRLLRAHAPRGATAAAEPGMARAIARYAGPRAASELLSQTLLWVDVLIVGAMAGPAAAGAYGAAARLSSATLMVDSALRVVVAPAFSRLHHRGDVRGLVNVAHTATCWLVLFSTPVALVLALFAPLALSLLGPSFSDGATALAILGVGAIITFLAGNIHSVLLMSGRSGLAAANKVAAVVTDVALLFLLVPLWGIAGAAVAWAAACLLDAGLAFWQVRRVLHVPVRFATALYPLAVALCAVGVPAVVARLTLGATWAGLAVALAAGGVALLVWVRADATRLGMRSRPTAAGRENGS